MKKTVALLLMLAYLLVAAGCSGVMHPAETAIDEAPAGPWPPLEGWYCPTPDGHHTLVLYSYQYSGRLMEYNKIVYLVGFEDAELSDQVEEGDKIGVNGPIVLRDDVVEFKVVESIELHPEEESIDLPPEVYTKIKEYDAEYARENLQPGEKHPADFGETQ